MDDLIRRADVFERLCEYCSRVKYCDKLTDCVDARILDSIPAVDAVEVETVCDMFMHVMRDECPCNYCGVDEWLPEACELIDECPNPSDKMGCWKQFIKHYLTRLDYMDTAAMEAEQERMGQRREDGLYESLKRGLEEAIAFENGEIECRTETREDGDE